MKKTILLVEDNATDEKLAVRAFRNCGVATEIVVVRDGAEALDYLFRAGVYADAADAAPTVVFLDLSLPKLGGFEVLRRLRADARTKLMPVVILTGSSEEEDLREGYSLGANAYVRKPVGFAELMDAAKTLGVFWLELNMPAPARAAAP